MSLLGYAVVEKFGPEKGDAWSKYLAWSGLAQIWRVVTLDGCLCPLAHEENTDEDWKHVLQQDRMIFYFRDLDYLLNRFPNRDGLQIIGFIHQPADPFPHGFVDPRFEFAGYDLMDEMNISALLNLGGGFPDSFSRAELNPSGLIDVFTRAEKVQADLIKNHRGEDHTDCDIWALWVYREGSSEIDR